MKATKPNMRTRKRPVLCHISHRVTETIKLIYKKATFGQGGGGLGVGGMGEAVAEAGEEEEEGGEGGDEEDGEDQEEGEQGRDPGPVQGAVQFQEDGHCQKS